MAIDFPNGPTNGQEFTDGGVTWIWDGIKWTTVSASGLYLPLSGGSLTGPLAGTSASFAGNVSVSGVDGLVVNTPAATPHQVVGGSGGANRWIMQLGEGSPETGGNVGADFALHRYNDDGTPITPAALTVIRSTGAARFLAGLVQVWAAGNPELTLCNATGARLGSLFWNSPANAIEIRNIASNAFLFIDNGGNFSFSGGAFVVNGRDLTQLPFFLDPEQRPVLDALTARLEAMSARIGALEAQLAGRR